jgi:SAM-dependent methyltransferase
MEDSAKAPYMGSEARAYHEGKRAIPAVARSWVCRVRAELFQPVIGPRDAVFEFGCGYGWNLGGLKCGRRVGHDLSLDLAIEVQSFGIEFTADLRRVEKGSFDVVLSHHSLEHVLRPAEVLGELRGFLKPGGKLLVAVPYERERRYRRFDVAEPNHHLFSWNVQTLGALVTVCGFRVSSAHLRRYGYDRRAAVLAARWRLGERGFRLIRKGLQRLKSLREVVVVAMPT